MKIKILFLCTGNSCRSQMAEGFAKKLGWDAYSAGTHPETAVNQNAIIVMNEMGIDINHHKPKSLDLYLIQYQLLNEKSCYHKLYYVSKYLKSSHYPLKYH